MASFRPGEAADRWSAFSLDRVHHKIVLAAFFFVDATIHAFIEVFRLWLTNSLPAFPAGLHQAE